VVPSAPFASGSALVHSSPMAVDEGRLVRNVVKLVTPPEYTPGERVSWSRIKVRRFLCVATKDRLHAAWRLSLYGAGRGEVLGLRWSDIDLRAKTLTVSQARVLVDYKVYIEPPKAVMASGLSRWMTSLCQL
jgi:integrase